MSLTALIALFASIATSFTSLEPMLWPVTRVLAQSTETNTAAKDQIQKPEKVEADKLLEQGNKLFVTSQFQAALRSYQQALKIYQSIKDREGEAKSLGGVGNAYYSLGDYKRAIDYHTQSLTIARAIGDQQWEAGSLDNLGIAYYKCFGCG